MDEAVICNECVSEAPEGADPETLTLEGWDFTGEFGPRCPECVASNAAPTQTEGLDGIADALGATKKEE